MFLMQGTSEPRLEPVQLTPPTRANPNSRPTMRPPYPVDEASFVDTCKRFLSIEDSLRATGGRHSVDLRGSRHGLDAANAGGHVAADRELTELLTRSLRCLSSFR